MCVPGCLSCVCRLDIPMLTMKDKGDLMWVAKNKSKIDYVSLAFVQQPEDIRVIRSLLNHAGAPSIKVGWG